VSNLEIHNCCDIHFSFSTSPLMTVTAASFFRTVRRLSAPYKNPRHLSRIFQKMTSVYL